MSMDKYLDYVLENTTERTLLEQLAEEASELTWSALKLIRAKGYSNNPTNIDDETATINLIEEIVDVTLLIGLVGAKIGILPPTADVTAARAERWAKRLGYEDDKNEY